ncbi:hypothetical protein FBU59_001593 [Linderina macrospora]|uniref:Uncharacterized protein n=1 Tax=Linderina macrospora TaxID=4868 RepID=A0ACC1JDD6_9FUNG|nr:hypothetical protein FBU59_001593 [Linderina macrospora]
MQAPSRRDPEVLDIGSQEMHISDVSITGVTRIRRSVLNEITRPAFAATTVKEAIEELRYAAGKLELLGIAKRVQINLDKTDDDGVSVNLDCVDGGRYQITTGVGASDHEGTANVIARLNNMWGGGESLEANYARGTKTLGAFQGLLSVPVNADPLRKVEVMVHQATLDHRPYTGCDEVRRSASLAYKVSRDRGLHELVYTAAWRELTNLGVSASPSLRSEAGHTLKSSIAYTFTSDSRNSPTVPTAGNLVKASVELAGLGGDVQFVKTLAEVQANQAIGSGEGEKWSVTSSAQAGLLWGLAGRTPMADRFFVGGSTSVRGFEHRGIGPRDHADALGGDVFYAAGVSLLTPLPFVETSALRGHVFANAGQCALLDGRGLQSKAQIKRFLVSPSTSVGVGLVYRHSIVRAELSLCVPLMATSTDRLSPRLQFGLGFQFL